MADYITELETTLAATKNRLKTARKMKIVKDSAPEFFDIIDLEISLAVNRMTQDKPLSYDEYLSAHGEVRGIRRIRNLIDSKLVEEQATAAEVTAIQDNLKLVKANEPAKQQ